MSLVVKAAAWISSRRRANGPLDRMLTFLYPRAFAFVLDRDAGAVDRQVQGPQGASLSASQFLVLSAGGVGLLMPPSYHAGFTK